MYLNPAHSAVGEPAVRAASIVFCTFYSVARIPNQMLEIRASEIFAKKHCSCLQSPGSDALWRNLFFSRILATAAVAPFCGSAVKVSQAEPPVQCFTDDPGVGLPVSAWA